MGDRKGSVECSCLPASPWEADQPQPPITPSLSGQSFSQSRSNDVVAPGFALEVIGASPPAAQGTPEKPRIQATATNMQMALSGQILEAELARSLAQALYIEQSSIDVEISFVEMGLDSVIGVEWIQSLNKQYVSNLAASCIYDYPTIRQLAGFLEKDLLKYQQTTAQSMSTPSLDDVLQQVHQRILDPGNAEKLLHQILP
jgi:hypothetical protein